MAGFSVLLPSTHDSAFILLPSRFGFVRLARLSVLHVLCCVRCLYSVCVAAHMVYQLLLGLSGALALFSLVVLFFFRLVSRAFIV